MKSMNERNLTALCLGVLVVTLLVPEIAQAQVGEMEAFGGLTEMLRGFVTLLIRQWAKLLAIGIVAWEFIRWKTGHADLRQFCIVIVACFGVAFSPEIVNAIWSRSSGSI